ncbi:MAG: replication factor C large subunit [Candidatus Aenigmarchaeota archaeon]|nr:replication factor C large subunit [Candidatus Aenigmarchaeota archaeon]
MWTEKYSPKKIVDVVGQSKAIEEIETWIKSWKSGKKALLFHGPPGVGKTSLVIALGREKNLDLIELNASNYRTAFQINEVIGKSIKQMSLFKNGKIFLIDEIDGLTGREDRGGVSELIKIIKESNYPIVLTTNNIWDQNIRSLKEHCQIIEFKKISYWDMIKRLQYICNQENITCSSDIIKILAKRSEGDLRSAMNDLETLSRDRNEITLDNLESLSQREREENIFDVLKIIFKTKSATAAKLSINNVDKDPEEIFTWIEQNIINEYEKPEEIAKAYDAISKADLFRSRIKIKQEYKFLKYMIDMMTSGVALSKKEMYRKFSRYRYPDKIKTLGSTKKEREEDNLMIQELSNNLHCSTKKVKTHFMPYLRTWNSKI